MRRRPHINFRPNPRQLEQIDQLAERQDVTRSEIIRNLIDRALALPPQAAQSRMRWRSVPEKER